MGKTPVGADWLKAKAKRDAAIAAASDPYDAEAIAAAKAAWQKAKRALLARSK